MIYFVPFVSKCQFRVSFSNYFNYELIIFLEFSFFWFCFVDRSCLIWQRKKKRFSLYRSIDVTCNKLLVCNFFLVHLTVILSHCIRTLPIQVKHFRTNTSIVDALCTSIMSFPVSSTYFFCKILFDWNISRNYQNN